MPHFYVATICDRPKQSIHAGGETLLLEGTLIHRTLPFKRFAK